jgi:hypothetical protein
MINLRFHALATVHRISEDSHVPEALVFDLVRPLEAKRGTLSLVSLSRRDSLGLMSFSEQPEGKSLCGTRLALMNLRHCHRRLAYDLAN